MEVQKCSWETNIGPASSAQRAAVVDLEFTGSALDESVARNLIGTKSSPKTLQQSIFSGNNTAMKSNLDTCDRQFQRPRTVLNEQHNNSGIAGATAGYTMSRAAANTFFPNWEHVHPLHDRLIKKTEMAEASGSAPDSPAGHSGALNAYTKQALDDLVSKILDEDSNSHHLTAATNRHIMNCDEFKQNVGNPRAVDNAQFGCNIWTNQQKLPAEYAGLQPQPVNGMVAEKQWKVPVSAVRMPPGLELPASGHQQHPMSHLPMSRQPGSVPSNEAGWLKAAEELAAAGGRCHSLAPNGIPQNTGGGGGQADSGDQYQQQQQALLLAQVQATLHALQHCPPQQHQQLTDEHGQHLPATLQRLAEQSRIGIACRKAPDEIQAVVDAQRSMFVSGKDATPISALQQSHGDIPLQGQVVPDLSKCVIGPTLDREPGGITVQPYPVPQQAFMQALCAEQFNNQPGGPSAAARRLLPACYQDNGRSFVKSSAVPLNCGLDRMQLEQNQLLVHGPNVRCGQPAWSGGSNPRQSPYSQYCVPSTDQYNMVGRLTPVMLGPAGDLYCSSVPSQIHAAVPSPVMVGSKFSRHLNASSELYVRLEECFEQLHLLEKEEKHAEAELAQQTPGRIASNSTAGSPVIIPRLPHNPTRVDRLYVESLREHSKVSSLVGRLWQCRGLQQPLHSSIYSVMETWMEGIRKVQARRKEEMVGMANRNHSSASRVQDNKDIVALAAAVTELLNHTRRARTALWCAVQMTSAECDTSTCSAHDPAPAAAAAAACQRGTDSCWHSPRANTQTTK